MASTRLGRAILASALLAVPALAAANWPAWRGPSMDGVAASDAKPPLEWSETENVLWKAPMPAWSAATPIVWGDRVFVMSPEKSGAAVPEEVVPEGQPPRGPYAKGEDLGGAAIYLHCLARADGAELWKREVGSGSRVIMSRNNHASPSPVTDGERVWTITGLGDLRAHDMDGNEIWKKDLAAEYGKLGMFWSHCSSPALCGEMLVIAVVHGKLTTKPSYLLALDKTTGKEIWRVDRPSEAKGESRDSYSTPFLFRRGTKTEIIVNGGDCVTGHDAASGKELWRAGGLNPTNSPMGRIFATCVAAGDLLIAPGPNNPMLALRIKDTFEGETVEKIWETRWGADMSSPVTDGKYVYIVGYNGRTICLEAETGKEIYKERAGTGTYVSSPVLADGRLYVVNDLGQTSVMQSGPEFKLLATNELEEAGAFGMATPAVAGNQIFLRTARYLYCIGGKS